MQLHLLHELRTAQSSEAIPAFHSVVGLRVELIVADNELKETAAARWPSPGFPEHRHGFMRALPSREGRML